jgi:two-component system heavy metal sensor histidine kinase CusS
MAKKYFTFPFYRSLRFRFGLLFGLLFLAALLIILAFLYRGLKTNLQGSFDQQLISQAKSVAQKTEINPLVVPLPDSLEVFLVAYSNKIKTDTLFNNLPFQAMSVSGVARNIGDWRAVWVNRELETGGVISVVYSIPHKSLDDTLGQWRLVLFILIPASLFVSIVAGYFLSDYLLRPVNSIIVKAGRINLNEAIELLDEPPAKDELHQLTLTLNRMLERIKKQSDRQNAFFASASHELRTPLSVMLTELQVLLAGDLPQETRSVLQDQLLEVQRINKIVNDFLLMGQLTSGDIVIHKERTDLADLVVRNAGRIKTISEPKQQVFKIDLQPVDAEFGILADAGQLSVVISNLLENAVKYGRPASTIHVTILHTADCISLSVLNPTDLLISDPEELKSEFRRQDFHREGFGLGLWIVDQLVKRNGGELHLSFDAPFFAAKAVFPSA